MTTRPKGTKIKRGKYFSAYTVYWNVSSIFCKNGYWFVAIIIAASTRVQDIYIRDRYMKILATFFLIANKSWFTVIQNEAIFFPMHISVMSIYNFSQLCKNCCRCTIYIKTWRWRGNTTDKATSCTTNPISWQTIHFKRLHDLREFIYTCNL